MPVKRVVIPQIGEVILSKRRGLKNLRLSITAKGEVRVSMPNWTPYSVGLSFAAARADWINKHLQSYEKLELTDGQLIGKAHRLHFKRVDNAKTTSRVNASTVDISTNLDFDSPTVQKKAAGACERALKQEAETLLPQRLATLAAQHGFKYKQVKVRKLTSRWGSCSHDKTINLSYYLMQVPWNLIDYVLLHELVHTQHLNHSVDFWQTFERVLPGAKAARKEMKNYKPRLLPS